MSSEPIDGSMSRQRVSITSMNTLSKTIETTLNNDKLKKATGSTKIAMKLFPKKENPLRFLTLVVSWIAFIFSVILFSTRIWFTGQIVIINPYLITIGALHLAETLFGLFVLYFKETSLLLRTHVIFYAIVFVLEISVWLIFLADMSVVSSPSSECASIFGCLTVSSFTYGFGIFYTVFSFIMLVLMIPTLMLLRDYKKKFKEDLVKKERNRAMNAQASYHGHRSKSLKNTQTVLSEQNK